MKKLLSLLLAIVVFVCSMSAGLTALAEAKPSGYMKNPFYTKSYSPQILKATTKLYSAKDYYVFNGVKYYPEDEALYKIVRDGLEARKNKVEVKLYQEGRIYNFSSVVEGIYQGATDDRLSISSTDGDYARWSVSGISWDYDYERDTNGYYYNLTIDFSYYANASEEQQADKKINSIVSYIRKQNWSDYQILKYVHDYICKNATYDYTAARYGTARYNYAFSSYGVLCKGKGVCQSYANAFYRICKELGYKVRFVSSNPNVGCHAWNLIQLDNKYYFVDCTWDDEYMDDPDFADEDPYSFFLVDYESLQANDTTKQHLLFKTLYLDDDYYMNNYFDKTSLTPYDYDTAGVSTYSVSLGSVAYSYNGSARTPSVTLTDKDGAPVKDFTVSYSKNVENGRALATIKQNGATTYRTFLITPQKMTSPTLKKSGRTSSSIYLIWTKSASKVDGYELQQYKNGEWKTIKKLGNETSYNVTKLLSSTTYKFRIRAFKTIDRIVYYGSYSNVFTSLTLPKNTSISSISTKSKSITVGWKKVTCSGYQIQYSTNSSMKNAKNIYVSSAAVMKKIAKLSKGKRYYTRVRAYKVYNNKKYYTSWSGKKSIIVK